MWGSSPLATVAARRVGDMLSANARYPVVAGALGEAGRGRVGLLDGVYGGLAESERDIFADPGDEPEPTRLRLLRAARRRPGRRGRRRRASRPRWRSAGPTRWWSWPRGAVSDVE